MLLFIVRCTGASGCESGEIYIQIILYLPSHFSMALISWRNASALSSQIFHNNIKRLISISALCTRNSSATFDNEVGGLVSRLVTVINGRSGVISTSCLINGLWRAVSAAVSLLAVSENSRAEQIRHDKRFLIVLNDASGRTTAAQISLIYSFRTA